jgi:hypothetical protein
MAGMPPSGERRKFRRYSPDKVRVFCVTGEFKELYDTVNFAKRVINIGLDGMCIETTGRLRPGVKMSVEIRFDALAGTLRSPARIVWAETRKEGVSEIHAAGLKFHGPEITRPVRDYLEGDRTTMVVARRREEYQDLKQKSEARKEAVGPKKGGRLKKLAIAFLILLLVYVGSFWGLVFRGRIASSGGIHYRYMPGSSKETEGTLSKVFAPLYWAFRKGGIEVAHEPP